MSNKIEIFEVLRRVDAFDIAFFNNLNEEEKKGIAPYTLMLWMAGCKSPVQIRQLNAFMNSLIFDIPSVHRELLYKLACISSDGKSKRYKWIKKKTNSKKYATSVDILRRHYHCSTATALGYIPLVDHDFVRRIAEGLGEQDDTLKKIKKELT